MDVRLQRVKLLMTRRYRMIVAATRELTARRYRCGLPQGSALLIFRGCSVLANFLAGAQRLMTLVLSRACDATGHKAVESYLRSVI